MPVDKLKLLHQRLTEKVLGAEQPATLLLIALLAKGHALIEGAVAHGCELISGELGLVRGDRELEVGLERSDLGRSVVGDANLANLAFLAKRIERDCHVGWMRKHVGPMYLVQVDHVGL